MNLKSKQENRVDRRVQKTRKLLLDSLLALILERGYEEVTIQDIIDRANVGRSTFYSHFENKEHLLIGNDNFQNLLSRSLKASSKEEINFLEIYEHVAENHRLAKAFFGKKGGEIIINHFHNMFAHIIKEHYKGRINPEKLEGKMFPLVVEASASAMCSLLFNWAINDMPFMTVEMANQSHDILNSIFKKYV